ncbi:hypothetical protein ACFOU0_13910 [Salinicoccus sesuvii]|uniref:Uncharacterized protein n=1 Tax=Salinicoccus sesuvii TaxID=868281 RepID=A0ABV7N9V0_9STAP
MSIIRIDGENTGSSSSMYDVILDKEGIDAWTYNNEINDADFSNQQAVVIGIIQYADVNTNITGFIPEVINDGSRSAEEVFKDNLLRTCLKLSFLQSIEINGSHVMRINGVIDCF